MMKKLSILLAICVCASLTYGCTKEKNVKNAAPSEAEEQTVDVDTNMDIPKEEVKYYAPFTGEVVDGKAYNNIPFMTIIENSKQARPQSGLVDADIVYETMAEGGIPRFIALFQKNSPKKIGPVRSARAYFINIAREYNLPFAHCGGSYEALDMIEADSKYMSLNEFALTGFFWRENDRKAPHNLYTSADKIRKASSVRSYVKPTNIRLKFDENFFNNSSMNNASSVKLNLNKYYNTNYVYKDGKYYKYMDEVQSVNKEDNRPIAVSNIVIQRTAIKKKSENKLMDIKLVGEGTGYVISNGKYIKINWSKADEDSQTLLKDENGNEISLSPGNTWWHIIDESSSVEIK